MTMICTTAMCAQGRASVQEMRNTFDGLAEDSRFDRGYYEPTVVAIEHSFNDLWSVFSELIPFNPSCCAIKDLGSQADALTKEMLTSVGGAVPIGGPGSQAPPLQLDQMVTLGMLALGAIVLSNISQATRR